MTKAERIEKIINKYWIEWYGETLNQQCFSENVSRELSEAIAQELEKEGK